MLLVVHLCVCVRVVCPLCCVLVRVCRAPFVVCCVLLGARVVLLLVVLLLLLLMLRVDCSVIVVAD